MKKTEEENLDGGGQPPSGTNNKGPAPAGALLINQYERTTLNKLKTLLKCTNNDCGAVGSYTNNGVGGNPSKSGVQLIQIKCTKCSKKTRLGAAIENTEGLDEELEQYLKILGQLPTEDKQAKRRRTASSDGTPTTAANGIRGWLKIPGETAGLKPLPPMSAGTSLVPTTAVRAAETAGVTTQPSPPSTAGCTLPLAGGHPGASGLGNQTLASHALKSEVTGVATQPPTSAKGKEVLLYDQCMADGVMTRAPTKAASSSSRLTKTETITIELCEYLQLKEMAAANKALELKMEFLNSKLNDLYKIVNDNNNNIIANNNNIIMNTDGTRAGQKQKNGMNGRTKNNGQDTQTKAGPGKTNLLGNPKTFGSNQVQNSVPKQAKIAKQKTEKNTTNAKTSYAAVAAKNTPPKPGNEARNFWRSEVKKPMSKLSTTTKKRILQMGQEKPKPQEFHRAYLAINKVENETVGDARRRMAKFLIVADLKRHLRTFSNIGKSVIEIYYCDAVADQVLKIINKHQFKIIEMNAGDFSEHTGETLKKRQEQAVQRLGFLLAGERIAAMRKKICEGFDQSIVDAAAKLGISIRAKQVEKWAKSQPPPKSKSNIEKITVHDGQVVLPHGPNPTTPEQKTTPIQTIAVDPVEDSSEDEMEVEEQSAAGHQ